MKLHLPIALFATVCCVSAQAAQEQVTITDTMVSKTLNATNTDGSSVNAINHWEHAGAVNNTYVKVESGAKVSSLLGGIVVGPRDYQNHTTLTNDTMDGGVVIDVSGGTVSGTIYGGNSLSQALPDADLPKTGTGNDYNAKQKESAEILGDKINVGSISINVTGGEIGTAGGDEAIMGGGGRYCGTESGGGIEVNISGGTINNKVYAGTNGGSTGYTKLNITGGTINSDVYGAGRKEFGVVLGSTNVTISGGTIDGNVYAAGDQDTVKGDAVVTVSGGDITGTVSGGGTNGAKVEGTSTLNIGDTNTAYNASLRIADFDVVNVKNGKVSITDLQIVETGTTINVATEAALELSLSDIVVNGAAAGLSFEGDGNVTLNTENLSYTFIVTNEMLAAGGEHTFTLMEGDFSKIFSIYLTLNGIAVNFVLEDGTSFTPSSVSSLELHTGDVDISSGIIIGGSGGSAEGDGKAAIIIKATIPEPTTATLSLLALGALAARRRRR